MNMGFDHIIDKHVEQTPDFRTAQEAADVITDVINNGELVKDDEYHYEIVKDGYIVSIRKAFDGTKKNWVVTSFKLREPNSKKPSGATPSSAGAVEGSTDVAPDGNKVGGGKDTTSPQEKQAGEEKSSVSEGLGALLKAKGDDGVAGSEASKRARENARKTLELTLADIDKDIEKQQGVVDKNVSLRDKKALEKQAKARKELKALEAERARFQAMLDELGVLEKEETKAKSTEVEEKNETGETNDEQPADNSAATEPPLGSDQEGAEPQSAEEEIPEEHLDTPANARARGKRRWRGQVYTRQGEVDMILGKETGVKFSDKDTPTGHYAIIDASNLQPSHIQGEKNPMHFIDEAQPKNRAEKISAAKEINAAKDLRYEEITEGVTAYAGTPTVNARGEAIQGNNRAAIFRYLYENSELAEEQEGYRDYLRKNAGRWGLTAEQIDQVANPVLVRLVDVDDNEAIRLGQFTSAHTETGGIQRIDPKRTAKLLTQKGFMEDFCRRLMGDNEDEGVTLMQLIDLNGKVAAELEKANEADARLADTTRELAATKETLVITEESLAELTQTYNELVEKVEPLQEDSDWLAFVTSAQAMIGLPDVEFDISDRSEFREQMGYSKAFLNWWQSEDGGTTPFIEYDEDTALAMKYCPKIDYSEKEYVCPQMFKGMESLTNIPPGFDLSKATDCSYAFYNCKSLKCDLTVDVSSATDISCMFYRCHYNNYSHSTLIILGMENVETWNQLFYEAIGFETIIVKGFTSKVVRPFNTQDETWNQLFYEAIGFETIIVKGFSSKVVRPFNTQDNTWFNLQNCKYLAWIGDMANIVDFGWSLMAFGQQRANERPKLDFRLAENMPHKLHFNNSIQWNGIVDTDDLLGFPWDHVGYLSNMFQECPYLKRAGDLPLTDAYYTVTMFQGCSALETVGNVTLPQAAIRTHQMFYNCTALERVESVTFGYTYSSSSEAMFYNCNALKYCVLNNLGQSASDSTIYVRMVAKNWGADSEEALQSLVDSFVNRTFDRVYAGFTTACTVYIHADQLARLTDEQKAQATAKGFTLTSVTTNY